MNPTIAILSLAVAITSSAATQLVSWLMRRDEKGRNTAAESTRVTELERRIAALESSSVSQRDLEMLARRLDAIQMDIREIRNYQVNHAATYVTSPAKPS